MAKRIRWTFEAEETFERVIAYLEQEWSEKEIIRFVRSTEKILQLISHYPEIFRRSGKQKNVHEALVTRHNLLLNKVYPRHIDLLVFWDTRQNPRENKTGTI